MQKTLLAVALVIGAVVVMPLAVGFTLPEEHAATSSVTLRQPIDSIWRVVGDLAGYSSWWPNIERVEMQSRGNRDVWVQYHRRNQTIPIEVVDSTAPVRLVTRIAEGLPFGGTWTYELTPAPGGTAVSITEAGAIYNPLFRVIARVVLGYHGTMDSYLTALGTRFGEDVIPIHVE